MRSYIPTLLNTDAHIQTLGLPVDNVFAAETVDTPESKPFIVIRWLSCYPSFQRAPISVWGAQVWAYDTPGDYSRIDSLLARVRQLFDAVEAQDTATGSISQIDWVEDSQDGYDDVWKSIYRNSTYRVVGTYLPR